jgi:hypothetical protein
MIQQRAIATTMTMNWRTWRRFLHAWRDQYSRCSDAAFLGGHGYVDDEFWLDYTQQHSGRPGRGYKSFFAQDLVNASQVARRPPLARLYIFEPSVVARRWCSYIPAVLTNRPCRARCSLRSWLFGADPVLGFPKEARCSSRLRTPLKTARATFALSYDICYVAHLHRPQS